MVAEELAQEALIRLWTRWDAVSSKGAPDPWLWTVAMNLARSKRRRRAAERRAQVRAGPASTTHTDPATADAVAVREAVAALPERQREAITLRYFVGLSILETAEVMGTAEGTVGAHTNKALAILRDALGDGIAEEVVHRD
jgi:RNA polymerase sigma-70 factor (ECF subfamily)